MILRANDIDTLVLYGIATSGVVLSTLLEAADADFRLAVIEDGCADLTPMSMIASSTTSPPPVDRFSRLGNSSKPRNHRE